MVSPTLNVGAALDAAYEHHAAGNLAAAESLCRQVLSVQPGEPEALHCLGLIAFQVGRVEAAIALVRAAIAASPTNTHYLNNLGTMLRTHGLLGEAIAQYWSALELDESRADVHYNLANALREAKDQPGAIRSYEAAIALQADFADAHYHLGNVLAEQGRSTEAAEKFLATLAIQPDHAGACYNLGNARSDQGLLEEAVEAYRRAIAIDAAFVEAHSNLLWTMQYMDGVSNETAFAEAVKFAELHESPLRAGWKLHQNSSDPRRRLRVGYVSPDFRQHSVAYFAESLIECHDRREFEIFCYYNHNRADAVTNRFMALADHWTSCLGMNEDALAEKIREDGIDILIDLAGHTAHHRLLAFARKPAPVQVTYLGYPATTGLAAIDYRLTDAYADPPGDGDQFYREKLVRLPHAFLSYRPPEYAGDIVATPALRNGYVTFGSFNALPKITPRVIALWARILNLLPTAHIALKAAGFENPGTRDRYLRMFDTHNVTSDRVLLLGKEADFTAHLRRYDEIDIGLDPFPYNGTTTTFEAMWMGVPTVTLSGSRHATRVGASLLTHAGLGRFVATSDEKYIEIAVETASDPGSLNALRQGMRDRLRASPLLDGARLAREIESAYRQMWADWCDRPASAPDISSRT